MNYEPSIIMSSSAGIEDHIAIERAEAEIELDNIFEKKVWKLFKHYEKTSLDRFSARLQEENKKRKNNKGEVFWKTLICISIVLSLTSIILSIITLSKNGDKSEVVTEPTLINTSSIDGKINLLSISILNQSRSLSKLEQNVSELETDFKNNNLIMLNRISQTRDMISNQGLEIDDLINKDQIYLNNLKFLNSSYSLLNSSTSDFQKINDPNYLLSKNNREKIIKLQIIKTQADPGYSCDESGICSANHHGVCSCMSGNGMNTEISIVYSCFHERCYYLEIRKGSDYGGGGISIVQQLQNGCYKTCVSTNLNSNTYTCDCLSYHYTPWV